MQQHKWEPGPETANEQLWHEVKMLLNIRRGAEELEFRKVKAHLSKEESVEKGNLGEAWAANHEADRLAD